VLQDGGGSGACLLYPTEKNILSCLPSSLEDKMKKWGNRNEERSFFFFTEESEECPEEPLNKIRQLTYRLASISRVCAFQTPAMQLASSRRRRRRTRNNKPFIIHYNQGHTLACRTGPFNNLTLCSSYF
jgi:hypothetical protein